MYGWRMERRQDGDVLDVLDVLPWTLSALVLGGAAAGRGHVITGHTAHQHHHQGSNHSAWLEGSLLEFP